jgi:NADH-quinone oxidoreductase subunit E
MTSVTSNEGYSGNAPAAPHPALTPQVRARLVADAEQIVARYPRSRSALLPLLHLMQAEQGYVSSEGIELCAEVLGLTTAEVAGRGDVLLAVQTPPGRRLRRRRLHQHAVRGHGR